MCPELCVTRKIWGNSGRKSRGETPLRVALWLTDQMALQMVKVSSLSTHMSDRLSRIPEDRM